MDVALLRTHSYFPDDGEGSINTIQFLEASRGLVWLVDQFGYRFYLVKSDLNQNIEKLQKKYEENTIGHQCLLQMIQQEHRCGETFATHSLLWLRRGLKLMAEFLSDFLENEKKQIRKENQENLLRKAYENSLKPHHNFIVRCLFKTLCSSCPSRTDLLNILGYDRMSDEKLFLSLLSQYLQRLESNLNALMVFCKDNDIKPHH